MSTQTLLIILLVGAIAGWLAGVILQGTGFGLLADIVIGIIGAFIGNWLLPQLGIHLGAGIVAAIISATIGALVLLLILGFFGRRRGTRRGGGIGVGLRLTPPTVPIFLISVLLAVIALLAHYAGVRIPIIAGRDFDVLAIGYVVLLLGVVFRGL